MKDLPKSIENFRILQISDLHEKEFGSSQSKLVNKINGLDYDAIVFTGDMLDHPESENVDSLYQLLEGIKNKENAWFVPGNTDPNSYQFEGELQKGEFIQGMEARGVYLLETSAKIEMGGNAVHFVNFELSITKNPEQQIAGVIYPSYQFEPWYVYYIRDQWSTLQETYKTIVDKDIVIALNHYPVPDPRINFIQNDPATKWRDFDLIIAGHYHGGQIRIPIIGAIFIPDPWYRRNGLFPPLDRVKGLWEYQGTKQYVSTGLGSSDALPLLKFRLFNTPEINLLTLKGK